MSAKRRSDELQAALKQIPAWVKVKEQRYKKQKAIAERAFGEIARRIEKGRKTK